MSDRVHALAEVWREIVAIDHHKHKDGFFSIIKSWSYDHQAQYHAEHSAYVGDDLCSPYRTTYAEAENDLIEHLLKMIEKHRNWAEDQMSINANDRWSEREAKHTLEVIERNSALIKGEQK